MRSTGWLAVGGTALLIIVVLLAREVGPMPPSGAPADAAAHTSGAAPPGACEVIEILASRGGRSSDPTLAQLSGALRRPPMNTWDTFVVASRHAADSTAGRTSSNLAAGDVVQLEFTDVLPASTRIVIDRGDRRLLDTRVVLVPRQPLLVGLPGQEPFGHLVAILCT